jgi:hypothetical protein
MELQISIIDLERVYRSIENLNSFQKDKAVQTGLKFAGALFIRKGRANLKERMKNRSGVTGNLLRSFRNKLKRQKLGVLAGFNSKGSHAHLVDRGTQERTTKKGYNRGKVEGNRFWTDSIESNKNEAIENIFTGIERAITRILNR